MKQPYLLLTPGPLSTTASVKDAMQIDYCTWDSDYRHVTETIRQQILAMAQANPENYTTVLLQGSGSFGVEATIGTAVPRTDATLMIAINGAYGHRISQIAEYYDIPHIDVVFNEDEAVDPVRIEATLADHPEITHFATVHSETTTGILNPIEALMPIMHEHGIVTIIDAMSSLGGVPISIDELDCAYLISSANKCVQGVPGFAFIIAKQATLAHTADNARSLCLDLYDQWQAMTKQPGKWRFTSPTHVVHAFAQALIELQAEGGVTPRYQRYRASQQLLSDGLQALGFELVIDPAIQGPIITSFKYPNVDFDFADFYQFIKQRGFVIYPGKVSNIPSFRIGTIGDVDTTDIQRLLTIIGDYQQLHR
ncbi:2-aminoethylphosphonate--pyruvate transaminase [Lactiplantibacillus plantarum]|uniref:2-aminoethylphosphonate--pyruvate transaminase n=1 Tax=Lactiplantibacillus plantarum TaxID=1590 RepID=UPI000CF941C0|nr:2-aminoethylphosphonate--pyruvate transaminase [Lactiplantibacillus plantarum]SPE08183.1 2-aminoethylphosphonate--pyruvate transaminase [Lactiplantibacillus plantarum]SPE12439.1 2-aminoethylphosphonate--pyruvate transaminase [Lactiplantibacillus plantarum]SPH06963.1 2-aminoethylphosphonate--pyruvate transaminase [Lactiplantibacillus plantarum]SPH10072.1 2-aminoethylphosphonate--pyruvate transaminase [Lactiplantibacillus plantarum]